MSRSEGKVTVSNFTGGLVTDYQELNTPANTTINESNCELSRKGFRERRLGMDYETELSIDGITFDPPDFTQIYIRSHTWNGAGSVGDNKFLVVQANDILYFFDLSASPLSGGIKSFTVDLNNFKVSGAGDIGSYGVQTSHGRGVLFVVGEKINPFYIEYNDGADTISTTQINIRIRDMDEQDLVGSNDAETYTSGTITAARKYDLYNQGWNTSNVRCYDTETTTVGGLTNVLTFHLTNVGKYPPKTKPWWVGKRVGSASVDVYDPTGMFNMIDGGNTLAPLGHFIINPFYKDRSTVSGISTLAIETKNDRPKAVAFFAGRAVYGYKNKLFYSQTIQDDLGVVAKCHQEADPTAENINELIGTDGGEITLTDAGEILAMIPRQNALLIFASNGVWSLTGTSIDGSFTATGYGVSKISSVVCISPRTIFDVEGTITFWGESGIYVVESTQNQQFSVTNICTGKIQSGFNAIPTEQKERACGSYDKARKVIVWGYSYDSDSLDNIYAFDRVLRYDTILQAWVPWTIEPLASASPYVYDIFDLPLKTAESFVPAITGISGGPIETFYSDQMSTVPGYNSPLSGVRYLSFATALEEGEGTPPGEGAPAGSPTTYTYGSGTFVIPDDTTSITIYVGGPGGGGNGGEADPNSWGAGGGEGGEAKSTYTIVEADWGTSLSYSVGSPGLGGDGDGSYREPGTSSTLTGTIDAGSISMTASCGTGSGGAASGGNVSNVIGDDGSSGGAGGSGNSPYGGDGGNGGYAAGGQDGANGTIRIEWS